MSPAEGLGVFPQILFFNPPRVGARRLKANLETAPMEAATTHWIPASAGMTQ